MGTTSIKVPTELRDRLADLARRQHTTLAAVIAHALDVAEEAEFWDSVRQAMPAGAAARTEDATLAGSLSDGLDPDEDWSDLL